MLIDCPHGCKETVNTGSIVLEYTDVTIYGDVCDRPNSCNNRSCRFFDLTKEGTQRYMAGMRKAHGSIEEVLTDRIKQRRFRDV